MHGSYTDLHDMLDRLTPEQAEAIRGVLRQLVVTHGVARGEVSDAERRLSFIGLIPDGPSDLAERAEEIIRSRFDDAA